MGHGVGCRAYLDTALGHALGQFGQKLGRDLAIDEEGIKGVADGGALGASVDDDVHPAFLVGGDIDVVVADADAAGDDGDGALVAAEAVETVAAAGDEHIYVFVHAQELGDQGSVGVADVLNGLAGQALSLQRITNDGDEREVAAQGLFAAAEDDGVAGLEAEDGDIDGGVGAGLVDDAEDADGDAPLRLRRRARWARRRLSSSEAASDGVGQRAATLRVSSARPRMRSGVRSRRSSRASLRPLARPSAMSSSFWARTSALRASKASAMAWSASFLQVEDSPASLRLAWRAAFPIASRSICCGAG